ncbi:hypothetical protein OROGR_025105 [Orobanche gracilis]
MPRARGCGHNRRTGGSENQGDAVGDGNGIGVATILQQVAAQMTQLAQAVQRNTDVTQNIGANQWLREVVRMNPPHFAGAADALGWEDWIFQLGKIFEMVDCPEDRKVPVAQYFLDRDAANWWEVVKPRDRVATWTEFQNFMRDEFCPEPIRNQRISEFFSAKPRDVPVSQAIIDYSKQLSYVQDQVKTEGDKIFHFSRRMRPEVYRYMAGFSCTTLREYQNKALAYELSISSTERMPELKKQRTVGNFSENQRSGSCSTETSSRHPRKTLRSCEQRKNVTYAMSNVNNSKTCYNCSRAGHTAKNCRSPLVTCSECGHPGHQAVHCETVAERFGDRVSSLF